MTLYFELLQNTTLSSTHSLPVIVYSWKYIYNVIPPESGDYPILHYRCTLQPNTCHKIRYWSTTVALSTAQILSVSNCIIIVVSFHMASFGGTKGKPILHWKWAIIWKRDVTIIQWNRHQCLFFKVSSQNGCLSYIGCLYLWGALTWVKF